jgi:CrcB protein
MDSDVELRQAAQRRELDRPWPVLGAISAGGALGAAARYGLLVAFPTAPPGFPWTIFVVNVTGCLLIGALMVLVTDVWPQRRLLRPFLGVGVLGGFTTFSTYSVELQGLVDARALGTAAVYLVGTLVAALAATWTGLGVTRWAVRRSLAAR